MMRWRDEMKKLLTVMLVSGVMISLLLSLGLSSSSLPPIALAAPGRGAPVVTAIEPNEAPNDLDITVAISGEGFAGTPTVYLGETELTEVTWVSETELSAFVPWGMDPGVYTLTVENPEGETATLADAFTVAQGIGVWTTGGPYGGAVESLVLGDEQGGIVYATISNVGLFSSRDGGESWKLIFTEIGYLNELEVDPTNPNRLYIAKQVDQKQGLYKSENGGDKWTAMPQPIPDVSTRVFLAFINPQNGILFGALRADMDDPSCDFGCGLFRFDETEQFWIRLEEDGLLDENTGVTVVAFDPKDPDIMYVGLVGGLVLKSVNGGQTWSAHSQTPLSYILRLVVNPVGGELWVCGPGGQLPGGMYRYNGNEWVLMYSSSAPFSGVRNMVFDPSAADTQSQRIWIAADGGQKSEDGGENWSPLGSSVGEAIALNPLNPQIIYGGHSGFGVFKTIDGGTSWHPVNEGLSGIVPSFLAVNPHDPAIIYGSSAYLYGTQSGGQEWQRLHDETNGPIAVDPANPQHVVVGSYISDDGWYFDRQFTIPMPDGMDEHRYQRLINSIIARPGLWLMGVGFTDNERPYFNYDGGGGIYLSQDGENWDLIKYDLDCPPTSFGFDPVDENILYASTSGMRGGINCGERSFLRSDDGGQTWQENVEGLPEWARGGLIAVEPTPPYRIFSLPFVSTDQGLTWNEVSSPAGSPINELLFLAGSPSVLYAATGAGLYRTMDGAQTWQRAQGNLGKFEIWSLAGVATEDGRHIVYAATIGGVEEADEFTGSGLRESSDALVNAGVYRLTTVFPPVFKIYLPLLGR